MSKKIKIFLIISGVALVSALSFLIYQNLDTLMAKRGEGIVEKTNEDKGTDKEYGEMEKYKNEEYGFEISYPKNYNKDEKLDQVMGFLLEVKGDVLASVYVGIDQVGYTERINLLMSDYMIEETDIPRYEEVKIEENIVDGSIKSFKAEYVRNEINVDEDFLEKEEVVELYAISSNTYILSCVGLHKECDEIISTFRLLE